MEIKKSLAFVMLFNKDKVVCSFLKSIELREFKRHPLFDGMKLYKGKNLVFTTKIKNSSMIITITEKRTKKITQLYKYYMNQFFLYKYYVRRNF